MYTYISYLVNNDTYIHMYTYISYLVNNFFTLIIRLIFIMFSNLNMLTPNHVAGMFSST